MIKSPREMTDVEIIDAYETIVDYYLTAFNNPIRPEFEKASRFAQFGYDVGQFLFMNDHVRLGDGVKQEKLKV